MLDATPWLRGFSALRHLELAGSDPVRAQRLVLEQLVRRAAATRFGRDHEFAAIGSIDDYRRRVPLRRYEDFVREYWQPCFPRLVDCTWPGLVPFFALTSGTTAGSSKLIPCTRDMLFANRCGAHDILAHHVANRPLSRVLAGKCLVLGGSMALKEEAPGVRSGDLSGIEASEIPWWEEPWVYPPRELAMIADWEEKIDRLARAALVEDIRAISGAPNWLLLFFGRLLSLTSAGGRLVDALPNLELVIHGGINFAPYRESFGALLEGSHAETREVYAASEGFLAVADRGDGEGLRLILDGGVFLEFVPVSQIGSREPTRHWIADAEMDVEYALVVSSCAGLWSYIIGDTVRLVDLSPPRIMITGRTNYLLSAVGEHVIVEEVEEAVRSAAAAVEADVMDYAVGCVGVSGDGGGPRHLFIVEFRGVVPGEGARQVFCGVLDDRLAGLNDDYAVHRAGDFGLKPPEVMFAPLGTFAAWMKKRGRLGGQNKVPRIINDVGLFADLTGFARRPDAVGGVQP